MTTEAILKHVHVRAPGKINVFLKVGEVMDDGYHDVATAYQAISLYEDVHAYPADDFSVSFSGSVDVSGVPTDTSNLAIRAAKALARRTGYRGGVRLEIEKHVPVAGGMGGGSADAAATLLACDALWGTERSRDDLLALAARLGADVPFALLGGTAVGTGRGDQLSSALAKGQFEWVLAIADFGMSTPQVYQELDAHRARHILDISPSGRQPTVDAAVLQALRAGDAHLLGEVLYNDLQAAALQLRPELGEVLEFGDSQGALGSLVSGSGPTIAFLSADTDDAVELQVTLASSGLKVIRAHGPVHGARIVSQS